MVAAEDCHAHLWQADTLGILPVIIITVWPYCSLAEHISRESKFRDSWCACSCVVIIADTDTQVRGPLSPSYSDLTLGRSARLEVLNGNQESKQMCAVFAF